MFRCALTELEEISYSVRIEGSSAIVQLPIGYDESTGFRYSILAAFDSVVGRGSDCKEFAFWVTEHHPEEDSLYELRDSLAVKAKIPSQTDRLAILEALRQMVGLLIDEIEPRVVTMIAREANLPRAAQRRYSAVAEAFLEKGYRPGRSDPFHGRQTWMMERLP